MASEPVILPRMAGSEARIIVLQALGMVTSSLSVHMLIDITGLAQRELSEALYGLENDGWIEYELRGSQGFYKLDRDKRKKELRRDRRKK